MDSPSSYVSTHRAPCFAADGYIFLHNPGDGFGLYATKDVRESLCPTQSFNGQYYISNSGRYTKIRFNRMIPNHNKE